MKHLKGRIFWIEFCLTIVLLSTHVFAQNSINFIEGSVSYMSSQNIYVKFSNTNGIEKGDTLFAKKENAFIPALIVQHLSSISCLGQSISDIKLQINDPLFAKLKIKKQEENLKNIPENEIEKEVNENELIKNVKAVEKENKQEDISGRISVSSYSNFSGQGVNDYHRLRYRLSIKARNISESKISAETYISFSHKLNEWEDVQSNLFNALKIYSLAIKYNINDQTSIWLGRKINPVIANVGAIDGIQFEHDFKNFFVGTALGYRPDYTDYSFNSKLFEYGAYIGHKQKVENGFTQTSLAFFEQRNASKTDRRFAYIQHVNTFLKNLSVFSSFELDLYKLEEGQPQNTISLTSLYFSLRYKVSRKLSLFGSYDSRKNVVYYETFKNYADEVLQQALRQGLRFRINYRPIKFINVGINAGTRSAKNDERTTNTLNSYISYTNVPGINSMLTLSGNLMQTNYLDGLICGARLSKDFLQGKIQTMFNYRRVNFKYLNANTNLIQNIAEANLSIRFNKKLYLSVNYELTLQKDDNYSRFYLHIRKRF